MIKVGDVINEKYLVEKILGNTNIAKTYLASDNLNKLFVLKILSLEDVKDWKIFDLFEREIKTLEQLNNKNIPKYIEDFWITIGEKKDYVFVQEYIDGENLEVFIKNGNKLSIDKIRNIFLTILEILNYLHSLNPPLIHRDINPKNLVLDKNGNIYLVDFGAVGNLVKETFAAAMGQTFVGTFGYMAPEQLFGKTTPQSDIYSLGVTILFLLTGKDPLNFEYENMKLDFSSYSNIPNDMKKLLDLMIEPNMEIRISETQKIADILNRKIIIEEKRDNGRTLVDARVGVSFRFGNGDEVYTVDEFESTLKKLILKKELTLEVITPISNFFISAKGWFENYHNSSYPVFVCDKILCFIEENEKKIQYAELIKRAKKLNKKKCVIINNCKNELNKNRKAKTNEAVYTIVQETDEKKIKRTKALFIFTGIIILISISIFLSIIINTHLIGRQKLQSIFPIFLAIGAQICVWGSIFVVWLANKFCEKRKVNITPNLQREIDITVKKLNEQLDFEEKELVAECKKKIFL